jgi:hypothetical protein
MQTRRLALEQAGHTVAQARDLRQVQAVCTTSSVSVVVLGQSLNANEKKRVSDAVLTFCKSALILELHTGVAPEFPGADAHLRVNGNGTEGFVEAVSRLMRKQRKAKA